MRSPRLVKGSCTPRPKKETKLSARITRGTSRVRKAVIGASILGRTWRKKIAAGPGAQSFRRGDIIAALHAERLAAHDARHIEPFDDADGDEDQHEIAADEDGEENDEEDERQSIEDFDEAHHREIDSAPDKAGDAAEGDAERQRDERGEQADGERDAQCNEDAGEKIAAIGVGAERKDQATKRHIDREPAPIHAAARDARGCEHIRMGESAQHPGVDRRRGR